MRKSSATKQEDKELKASIAAHGILENLIVSPKDKKGFPVEGGGRRYTQFGNLVKEKVFSAHDEIACYVRDENESAKTLSLIENFHRVDPHPVDAFEAFTHIIKSEKCTIRDVAKRFGKTEKYVKQRVALGAVSPVLIDKCRKGDLDVDLLMAFTITDDHEKQLAAYNELKGDMYGFSAHNIKLLLTDKAITSDHKLVKLVGLKEYKKAKGTVTSDLFENTVYLNDKDILDKLVNNKIEKHKKELATSDWKWIDVKFDFQPSFQLDQYYRIQTEYKNAPKKLLEELNAKRNRLTELEDLPYGETTEEQDEEMDSLDHDIYVINEKLEKYESFCEKEIPLAGCIISINSNGDIVTHHGLVKPSDMNDLHKFRNGGQPEELNDNEQSGSDNSQVEDSGLSDALKQDLSAHRRIVTAAALSQNIKLSSDLMRFGLCWEMLSGQWNHTTNISIKDSSVECSKGLVSTSKAAEQVGEFRSKLDLSWLGDSELESFKVFRQLTEKKKSDLMAFCSMYSLNTFHDKAFSDYLISESNLNIADYWRPTADAFFKRVPVEYLDDLGNEKFGDDWKEGVTNKSKGQLAEVLERAFVDGEQPCPCKTSKEDLLNWIPDEF
jgi:ParB family chromosome partitioning protein